MDLTKFYSLVVPTKKEEEKIKRVIETIKKNIKIKGAKIFVGGSFAKGTWLKGLRDLDIYVIFNKKFRKQNISEILRNYLEKKFKVKVIKGSRDYFQIKKDGFVIEIIPILKIDSPEEAQNITDISPFHVRFVNSYPNLKNDIRLAKAFCKSIGVYGAESYIRGFSGYVLEVLTIYYGSFYDLIVNASKWKKKTIIDPMGYYRGKEVLKEMNIAKIQSPLILVDPVQKTRNAAAGLSEECYKKFIEKAREFIKKPSEEFFIVKKFDIEELKKKWQRKNIILIIGKAKRKRKDIAGAKLLKFFEFIKKSLEGEGFKLTDCGWSWDGKAYFWFVVEKKLLPMYKIHWGPPIKYKERLKNFRKKWKKKRIYVKNGISYVKVKREFRDAYSFVKSLIKKDYPKDKINKPKIYKF